MKDLSILIEEYIADELQEETPDYFLNDLIQSINSRNGAILHIDSNF